MRDVINHIQRRLPQVSAQIGQSHTPMIISSGLDFRIARRTKIQHTGN